jgi:hypothetical protein
MGWGDEIMASGRAREAQRADPRPVVIADKHGQPRWHEAWRGNPRIAALKGRCIPKDCQVIIDGPGARPYVDTSSTTLWRFRAGQQLRGELYLDDAELAFARRGEYVLIEPNVKAEARNKCWPLERWAAVVEGLPEVRWVQAGACDAPTLPHVERVCTDTFRQAAGLLSGARAALVPEGGLHHAAAALGVPAVVLYGGFITPEITGYPEQVAIVDCGPRTPCGARSPCPHCRASWDRITPAMVIEAVKGLLTRSARPPEDPIVSCSTGA